MALDYKVLQTVDPESLPTREQYCPDCGQSLTPPVVGDDRPSARPGPWALKVVGVFLLGISALHALRDTQLMKAVNGSSANQILPNAGLRSEHDFLVGAVGLVLLLVGFGAEARHRLTRDNPARMRVLGAFLGVWRSGETLVISLFGLIALAYCFLLVSELGNDETLSLGLIDRTLHRVVDVIVLITELVAAGYPRL